MNQIATAPAYKGIADFQNDTLEVLRDTQDLTSENLSGSEIAFYPRSADGDEPDANYTKNPLPGNRPYDVVGIGAAFTHEVLKQAATNTDVDLEAFLNDLAHAKVSLKADQRREELIDLHLTQITPWRTPWQLNGNAANDGYDRLARLPGGLFRLPDPIHISTQEVFELVVRWKSTTNFPAEADWDNLGQGTLGMILFMQVAYNE